MPALARFATPRTPSRRTYGGNISRLAVKRGRPLMPWQRQVVDVASEITDDGRWAYPIVIVTVQRQAGKTKLVGDVNLHRCALKPEARCWLTAQTRQDARDTWMDVAADVAKGPLRLLYEVRRSNGSEALTSVSGATFRVFAPTEDALHGKANELVTVDEAWAFDAVQGALLEQAIMPTFTTTGGQLWIVSTAGTLDSEWLLSYIDRGREAAATGRTDTVAYFEWALDPTLVPMVTEGLAADPGDPARAAAFAAMLDAHPANGHTLRVDALEQAAAVMSQGGFLRAFGNVWTRTSERTIPEHLWTGCQVDGFPPPEPGDVALAFDVALDRSDAAIMAAWRPGPAAKVRVDVIDAHPGTGWVVPRFRELVERWRPVAIGYDRSGPAVDVADELTRGGLELTGTNAREYATACVAFLSGLTDQRLEHRGRVPLDDAVAAAGTRPLADAWVWSRRRSGGSIAPLTAATIAAYLYDHRPPPPTSPVVVSSRRKVPTHARSR